MPTSSGGKLLGDAWCARVLETLAASDAPVRFLTGPLGSGKTITLRAYAERYGATYLAIKASWSWNDLALALRGACGAREVLLDGADALAPDVLERLVETLEAPGEQRRYLVAGRSRRLLAVQRLVATGVAQWFGADLPVLQRDDVSELAARAGLAFEAIDVDQLHYDTDGWPVAVGGVLRHAARNGGALRGALDAWARNDGRLLLEMVTDAIADEAQAGAFADLLGNGAVADSDRLLERLEANGHPVIRTRVGVRPYRVLLRIAESPAAERPVEEHESGTLAITLLGPFSCEINGRRVTFARRRDQNVLAYVALAPGASVSRAELMQAFWPDADPAVASQGVRTSLSRLRRAIAAAAGVDAQAYVTVDRNVALDLGRVTVDARRFAERIRLAQLEEQRGDLARARAHCTVAERIYTGPLLASEAVEAPLMRYVAEYGRTFETLLARLIDASIADGDRAAAERLARRSAQSLQQPELQLA